jgi:hypothetical protein
MRECLICKKNKAHHVYCNKDGTVSKKEVLKLIKYLGEKSGAGKELLALLNKKEKEYESEKLKGQRRS